MLMNPRFTSFLALCVLLTCMDGASQDSRPARSVPNRTDVADLDYKARGVLLDHLRQTAKSPVDYLALKVSTHDVVLLGEIHQVRDTCELVAASLAPLYHRAELRCLATEFLRSKQSERINELVTAKEWQEDEVVDLMRSGPWPIWGFRGYLDILHAAWQLNRGLPADAKPLRVCGIDSDWEQYDLWFTIKDRGKHFRILMNRERTMFRAVDKELKAGRKTLVHVGYAHTITNQGLRLGTQLRKKHGKRVFQVAMHHAFPTRQGTAVGTKLLEELLAESGDKPLGFDILDSPFAGLKDRSSLHWVRLPQFVLKDFAEGYVILRPVLELRKERWIPGFITGAMFQKAEPVAVRLGWVQKGECKTAAELNAKAATRFPK